MVPEGMLRAARMMMSVTKLELGTEGNAMALTEVRTLQRVEEISSLIGDPAQIPSL